MPLTTTPARVLEAWHGLGLTDEALTQATRVDVRTLQRWLRGTTFPQNEARTRLAALEILHQHLLDFFASEEDAQAWLFSDSRYLGGLKPADAILVGRTDRVEAALEAIASGIFT